MSDRQSKGLEETGTDEILGRVEAFAVARNQGETKRKVTGLWKGEDVK